MNRERLAIIFLYSVMIFNGILMVRVGQIERNPELLPFLWGIVFMPLIALVITEWRSMT